MPVAARPEEPRTHMPRTGHNRDHSGPLPPANFPKTNRGLQRGENFFRTLAASRIFPVPLAGSGAVEGHLPPRCAGDSGTKKRRLNAGSA